MCVGTGRETEVPSTVVGLEHFVTNLKKSYVFNTHSLYDPAVPLLNIYPRTMKKMSLQRLVQIVD